MISYILVPKFLLLFDKARLCLKLIPHIQPNVQFQTANPTNLMMKAR